ncbi:LysM peptidoglycan-binding domain-containing protein [candidate division KSB1 bacterium]|nr:LysM peptidoglycan-binding domain-containing protein [candidate division KSB1 bacterium]
MVKFMVKGVIFLMGLQSLFGNLQKYGIIEGSIRINPTNIQRVLISVLNSEEVNSMISKLDESNIDRYFTPPEAQAEEYQGYNIRRNNDWSTPNNTQINDVNSNHRQMVRYANAVENEQQYDFNNLKNKTIRCYNHVVQRGETLQDLSNMYGVAHQVIMKVNRMYEASELQVGQNVYIPTRMA